MITGDRYVRGSISLRYLTDETFLAGDFFIQIESSVTGPEEIFVTKNEKGKYLHSYMKTSHQGGSDFSTETFFSSGLVTELLLSAVAPLRADLTILLP